MLNLTLPKEWYVVTKDLLLMDFLLPKDLIIHIENMAINYSYFAVEKGKMNFWFSLPATQDDPAKYCLEVVYDPVVKQYWFTKYIEAKWHSAFKQTIGYYKQSTQNNWIFNTDVSKIPNIQMVVVYPSTTKALEVKQITDKFIVRRSPDLLIPEKIRKRFKVPMMLNTSYKI